MAVRTIPRAVVIAGCINRADGSCGCDAYPPRERALLLRAAEVDDETEAMLSDLEHSWPDAMDWSPA